MDVLSIRTAQAFESALSIDFLIRTEPREQHFVAFLEVILLNIGSRRISAPPRLTKEEIEDYEQSVLYPADLQIRRLRDGFDGPKFVGWWSKANLLESVDGLPPHINLLFEYTRSDGKIDFFMEPKEQYTLGSMFVLPAGHYAAKVVFVGKRAKAAEFWGRIVYFQIPAVRSSSKKTNGIVHESNVDQ
jgi:hypothetical protein